MILSPTTTIEELGTAIAEDEEVTTFCKEKYGRDISVWLGAFDKSWRIRNNDIEPDPYVVITVDASTDIEAGPEVAEETFILLVYVCVKSSSYVDADAPTRVASNVYRHRLDKDLETLYKHILRIAKSNAVGANVRRPKLKADQFTGYPYCDAMWSLEFYTPVVFGDE